LKFKQYLTENVCYNINDFFKTSGCSISIYSEFYNLINDEYFHIYAIFKYINGPYKNYTIAYYKYKPHLIFREIFNSYGNHNSGGKIGELIEIDTRLDDVQNIKNSIKQIENNWERCRGKGTIKIKLVYSDGADYSIEEYHRPEDEINQNEYAD